MDDMPPSDMPTTPRASGASSATTVARSRPLLPAEIGAVGPAVGVAVPRQVDREERAAQGEGHGVPGVGVLRPAVDEHELGAPGPPPQTRLDTGGRARPRRRRAARQAGPS